MDRELLEARGDAARSNAGLRPGRCARRAICSLALVARERGRSAARPFRGVPRQAHHVEQRRGVAAPTMT
jgi:hypothetical protein